MDAGKESGMEMVVVEEERVVEGRGQVAPQGGDHLPPVPGRALAEAHLCPCPGLDLVALRHRFVSLDGARVLSVFQAPDAEIVRRAMRFLSLPGYRTLHVWTVQR